MASTMRKVLSPSSKNLAIAKQKTVHAGWLWKQGGWNKTNLQRRWFEIKGDQLYYFKAKGDSSPLGQVPLAGNKIIKHAPLDDEMGKYVFEIAAGEERQGRPVTENSETLIFAAASPMELNEWTKAINRVIYSPQGGGMFGRSIVEQVRIDSRKGGGMVPIILERCVKFIKEGGLDKEGIFRVTGLKDDVEELKDQFNKGNLPDLIEGTTNVHVVASVVKQYLGELPEPVIPFDFFDPFIEAGELYKRNQESGVIEIEKLLMRIPRAHFNVLKYLSRFLFEIQENSQVNMMTAQNLALVFGPNILSPNNEDPTTLLSSIAVINNLTMYFITNQKRFFPVTPDETYYTPKPQEPSAQVGDLLKFDFDEDIPLQTQLAKKTSLEKSWHSEGNLVEIEENSTDSGEGKVNLGADEYDLEERNLKLQYELEEQRIHFEEQLKELETRLDAEAKIREMLKMRLMDEHTARVSAEERLERYRAAIEEYCRKFGHEDISIR